MTQLGRARSLIEDGNSTVGVLKLWIGAELTPDDLEKASSAIGKQSAAPGHLNQRKSALVIGGGPDAKNKPTRELLLQRLKAREKDPKFWAFGTVIPEEEVDSHDVEGGDSGDGIVIQLDGEDVAFVYSETSQFGIPDLYKVGPTYGGATEFIAKLFFRGKPKKPAKPNKVTVEVTGTITLAASAAERLGGLNAEAEWAKLAKNPRWKLRDVQGVQKTTTFRADSASWNWYLNHKDRLENFLRSMFIAGLAEENRNNSIFLYLCPKDARIDSYRVVS